MTFTGELYIHLLMELSWLWPTENPTIFVGAEQNRIATSIAELLQ